MFIRNIGLLCRLCHVLHYIVLVVSVEQMGNRDLETVHYQRRNCRIGEMQQPDHPRAILSILDVIDAAPVERKLFQRLNGLWFKTVHRPSDMSDKRWLRHNLILVSMFHTA